MIYDKIEIWEGFKVDNSGVNNSGINNNGLNNSKVNNSKVNNSGATLQVYIPDNFEEISLERKNPAVVILPGGAYDYISDREGEPVALAFLGRGFNVFVLNYGVAPKYRHPQPLLDVSRAVCLIRQNGDKWHTDIEKIAVCGFSAGGHLAASLGVFWKDKDLTETLKISEGMNRPNALILCYPVISARADLRHQRTFDNILGKDQQESVYQTLSLEDFVHQDTPPAFLWHTFEDEAVPVEHTLLFAQSLKKNHIPFELHVFPKGGHGMALSNRQTGENQWHMDPHIGKWMDLCIEWLETLAFNAKK